jgi:putative ABC transport system ATP-binding protein
VGPSVLAKKLTFAYPSGTVLFDRLEMAVPLGTLTVVTGRSGVGKSTLLYCLAGVLQADGYVELMGQQLTASPAQRATVRLTHCGFIFQRGELLPELSVVENVALPLRLTGVGRRDAHAAALSSMRQLGIEHCANRPPDEISGGQAQRASVARALINRPAIVFADEPTASLDASSRDDVLTALHQAVSSGTTIVCATHDPALVEIADATLDLGDGSGAPRLG